MKPGNAKGRGGDRGRSDAGATEPEGAGGSDRPGTAPSEGLWSDIAPVARWVLAVSYPVLAVSTGARALYRLALKDGLVWSTGSGLSLLAALLYLGATVGFALRRRWAWWTSVALLVVETALTLVVGTITWVEPGRIGSTVWRLYGADYGFFPLFQPLLGLVWLLWPETMRAYGVRGRAAGRTGGGTSRPGSG